MTYVPDLSGNSVVWLDRGWQPAHIGYCPSKRAWRKEMRRLGVKGCAPPTSSGNVTTFANKSDGLTIIIWLAEGAESRNSRFEIAGLLAHESTHVWQHVRDHMGEKNPSIEFEAYSVQAIFQNVYRAWWDTRGKRNPPKDD